MNKRFLALYESAITRHTNGGFLVGDLVTLTPDAMRNKHFEHSDELKQTIKAMQTSDLNIRIMNIKGKYPAVGGGSNEDNISRCCVLVDIAQEIAPGRTTNRITVPAEVLQVVTTTPNLTPVPNSVKYNNKIKIKPVVPKTEEGNEEFSNKRQTQANTPSRSLPVKNTKIPASPAAKQKDPASYTASYMPSK